MTHHPSTDHLAWLEGHNTGSGSRLARWHASRAEQLQAARSTWTHRDRLLDALAAAEDAPRDELPTIRGGRCYTLSRRPANRLPVLRVRPAGAVPGPETVLLDPLIGDPTGQTSVTGITVAPDGGHVVVQTAAGSENGDLHVLHHEGRVLQGPDRPTRRCAVAWDRDGLGFAWVRTTPGRAPSVWRSRLDGDEDQLVCDELSQRAVVRLHTDPSTGSLVIASREGTAPTTTLRLADEHGCRTALVSPHRMHLVAAGQRLVGLVSTDHGDNIHPLRPAADGSTLRLGQPLLTADPARPVVGLTECGPQHTPLILVVRRDRGLDNLTLHHVSGSGTNPVDLSAAGDIVAVSGVSAADDDTTLLLVSTPTSPARLLRLDLTTARVTGDLTGDDGVLHQRLTATSPDGTPVDVVVSARRDLLHEDGSPRAPVPVLLTCYGGFGVTTSAGYDPSRRAWTDAGGVYATAHVRGGGEKGTAWHAAGTREHKPRSVEDLIAVCAHLLDHRWAPTSGVVLAGASHGGLLAAAAGLRRPDLVASVVLTAPLVDLERFASAGLGHLWTDELGDPDHPEDLEILRALSPLVAACRPNGAPSPPMLVITSSDDNRVPPWHGEKLVEALLHGPRRPTSGSVLLRREDDGGHSGRSIDRVRQRSADILAFAMAQAHARAVPAIQTKPTTVGVARILTRS